MRHNIDEAKLTSYALGEVDKEEQGMIESLLAEDAEARRHVEEVRAMAGVLAEELKQEQGVGLGQENHRVIEQAIAAAEASPVYHVLTHPLIRSSRFWWITSGLAACLVLGLASVSVLLHSNSTNSPLEAIRGVKEQVIVPDMSLVGTVGEYLLRREAAPQEHHAAGQFNTEAYDRIVDNSFLSAKQSPLSTFAIDVDTASYSNVRRLLNQGTLPPKDAVRIEEMINYFPYCYELPKGNEPFATQVEVAECPWNSEHRLARIAMKGREIDKAHRPASNLVFLLDVSGSMSSQNKLPLVKSAMRLLVESLDERDCVSIVVYAGESGLVLPPTRGDRPEVILEALDRLQAGGITNGAGGIEMAYRQATEHFIEGGTNRVILCTDGDFNVGITDQGSLTRLIEEKAKSRVFLSVLGFGMGNLKDSTMEKLADKGHGNYAYIDTLGEARKVLVEQMTGTLVTIARDVKVQVEFNPAKVGAYRLIGYENRLMAAQDFNDDKKDGGDIGAGHTVTALYEIVPADKPMKLPGVDALKYQHPVAVSAEKASDELMTVKLRYKLPEGSTSILRELPVKDEGGRYAMASGDFRFAAAVAEFGMILRDSPHKGRATYGTVLELAGASCGEDRGGYRKDFVELVQKAKTIAGS